MATFIWNTFSVDFFLKSTLLEEVGISSSLDDWGSRGDVLSIFDKFDHL